MTIRNYLKMVLITAAIFLTAFAVLVLTPSHRAKAEKTFSVPTDLGVFDVFTFFSATTTNATSTNMTGGGGFFVIAGAKDVNFFFTRGDTKGTGNSGSSIFKVQVSPDGQQWIDYNELGLIQVSGDANVYYQRVGTTTIAAATSTTMAAMDDVGFYAVRCIAVRVTDGEASCKATVQY